MRGGEGVPQGLGTLLWGWGVAVVVVEGPRAAVVPVGTKTRLPGRDWGESSSKCKGSK